MPITIAITNVSKNKVEATVTETPFTGANFFFELVDSEGRQLDAGQVPAQGTPLDLSDALTDEDAGAYELRIYATASWDVQQVRPRPRATTEAVKSLQFIAPPLSLRGLPPPPPPPPTVVRLDRGAAQPTVDEVLSTIVLTGTGARAFGFYKARMDQVVCRTRLGIFQPEAYEDLLKESKKFLDEGQAAFIDQGGVLEEYRVGDKQLPYLADVASRFADVIGDPCSGIDPAMLQEPFPIELIWSYWEEEGGLVQALNRILARFQNRRTTRGPDPLARFDLHPLRPLRHLLWSWAEDESDRLTVRRRAAEYEYEYGLPMVGRAVPRRDVFVERRSRFLDAFHTLLHEALTFYALDDDTTVNADAFPVYNALRDTHLVLAEGASNQFGSLAAQARVEMWVMQYLLAQPEMRDFLGGKPMVPYEEEWMDRIDTMKAIMGWSGTSITHFHELAVHGERLLLTIRWNNWNSTATGAASAKNWARTWRNTIQRYAHSYRAVTGVDLTIGPDSRAPAHLLARRAGVPARRV
jgi:hypothetical protein